MCRSASPKIQTRRLGKRAALSDHRASSIAPRQAGIPAPTATISFHYVELWKKSCSIRKQKTARRANSRAPRKAGQSAPNPTVKFHFVQRAAQPATELAAQPASKPRNCAASQIIEIQPAAKISAVPATPRSEDKPGPQPDPRLAAPPKQYLSEVRSSIYGPELGELRARAGAPQD